MTYFTLLILSLCLARIQYLAARKNIGARWNGYGAIDGVLNRSGDAPMVYRVLLPWLIGRDRSIGKYQLWQTILIFASLLSVYTAWGTSITIMSVILFTPTFWYDYWDWTVEIIGFSLALTHLPLAICGAALLSLSRETAPLVGLVYALHSGDWLGGLMTSAVAVLGLAVVRKVQGQHKLYCERWMWRVNLGLLGSGNVGAWTSAGLCLMGLVGALGRPEFVVIPAVVGAGWLMAKADETRVFVAVAPYAASLLVRWLWV